MNNKDTILFMAEAQGCSYGSAKFGVFRNNEMNFIQFLQSWEDELALWHEREVANENILCNATIERGKDSCRTYRLQHRGDDAFGYILPCRIALCLTKK